MNAVDPEELIRLLAQALMRDAAFRPRGRNWALNEDRRQLAARICAAGLVEHLYSAASAGRVCRPGPPHKTPG